MASAALPSVGRSEVLSLLRSFLRTTRKFADYNIREYSKRRTIDAFRQNKDLSPPSAVSAAFSDGESQLEVARRQATVYSLYAPKVYKIANRRNENYMELLIKSSPKTQGTEARGPAVRFPLKSIQCKPVSARVCFPCEGPQEAPSPFHNSITKGLHFSSVSFLYSYQVNQSLRINSRIGSSIPTLLVILQAAPVDLCC